MKTATNRTTTNVTKTGFKKALSDSIAKARLAKGFFTLVKDPGRLSEIVALADALEMPEVMERMAAYFARDASGARAMQERPRVGRFDPEVMRRLPEGTFGRAYAEHALANGIDPHEIPELPAYDATSFVRAHLFETHDIWHTATGFQTDFASEIGLQAFYFAQFPAELPATIFAINFLNLAFVALGDREARMDAIVRGWTMGKRAKPLFGVRWADLWETPLVEVRRSLDIPVEGAATAPSREASSLDVAPVAYARVPLPSTARRSESMSTSATPGNTPY
jgi:ubiquinone biosynthesis protein Coq4